MGSPGRGAGLTAAALAALTAIGLAAPAGAAVSVPAGAVVGVYGWGLDSSPQPGQPAQVSGLANVLQVAEGQVFGAALLPDHTVDTWGYDGDGELGDGRIAPVYRTSPAPVLGLDGVVQIAAGYQHVLALKSDGTVWAWGLLNSPDDVDERADGSVWVNCPAPPCSPGHVDDETGSMLAAGASALTRGGDLGAARRYYDAAYEMAEQADDEAAMALAALGMGGLWVHEYRTAAGSALLQQRLNRALSAADPRSTLALRLRVRLAGESDFSSGDSAAILAALAEARAVGDPVTRAEALSLAHQCLPGPGHGQLRRELATELIGESFRTGRRSDLLVGLLCRTADLFADGNPRAQRHLEELRQELAREDHRGVSFVVAAMDVMLAIRSGDLERAERLAEVCSRHGEARDAPYAAAWHAAHLLTIRWYQGRLGESRPALRRIVDSPSLSEIDNSMNAVLAVAAALAGDHHAAASALAAVCGRDLLELPRSISWLVTMNGVVEAAHLLGDANTAGRAYELLCPYADLPMVARLGVTCLGSVHHALGVACLTTGDLDRAVTHLRTAVTRNLALAHWPAVIDAVDLAAGVAALGRSAETGSVQPVLDEAALGQYRLRLTQLNGAIDAAESRRDQEHGERARAERDWLTSQLTSAAGLGRRTRPFADSKERARLAVGKSIRRTVEHVAEADAMIGDHLRRTVRTGARCSYWPS
jgi:hypothetical protein